MRKVPIEPLVLGATNASPRSSSRLAVSTYNVWFSPHAQVERHKHVLHDLMSRQVDLMAFQEVTACFMGVLERSVASKDSWFWFDDWGHKVGHYGTGILTRERPTDAWFVELPSNMGRCLVAVVVDSPAGPVTFASVHMESLDNPELRQMQMEVIFDVLSDCKQAFLVGDFNFCATDMEENAFLDPRFDDLWSALRPDEVGLTRPHKPVRFDRVLYAGGGRPNQIELLGTEPIAPGVLPSDHFGLYASVDLDRTGD